MIEVHDIRRIFDSAVRTRYVFLHVDEFLILFDFLASGFVGGLGLALLAIALVFLGGRLALTAHLDVHKLCRC